MTARPDDQPDHDVVRTRRLEVLDARGTPRIVVGDLAGSPGSGEVFGLAVLDRSGRHRAWLSLDGNGVNLCFDRNGNAVLELGVHDDEGEAVEGGAYVQLSDVDGRPALGWSVDDDGAVLLRVVGPGA